MRLQNLVRRQDSSSPDQLPAERTVVQYRPGGRNLGQSQARSEQLSMQSMCRISRMSMACPSACAALLFRSHERAKQQFKHTDPW
jgi:hypothetical protein